MRVGSNSVPIPMGCGLHYLSAQYLWFDWCQQPFKWQINDLGTQSLTELGIRKSVVWTTRQSEETKNARHKKKGKCEILARGGGMQDACKKYKFYSDEAIVQKVRQSNCQFVSVVTQG